MADIQEPIFDFREKQIQLCSINTCKAGHEFRPTAVVTACPECGSPILMVKQENCPYCNEPVVKTKMRSDYIPKGAGLVKRCIGQIPAGETLDIDIERVGWLKAEENWKPREVVQDIGTEVGCGCSGK